MSANAHAHLANKAHDAFVAYQLTPDATLDHMAHLREMVAANSAQTEHALFGGVCEPVYLAMLNVVGCITPDSLRRIDAVIVKTMKKLRKEIQAGSKTLLECALTAHTDCMLAMSRMGDDGTSVTRCQVLAPTAEEAAKFACAFALRTRTHSPKWLESSVIDVANQVMKCAYGGLPDPYPLKERTPAMRIKDDCYALASALVPDDPMVGYLAIVIFDRVSKDIPSRKKLAEDAVRRTCQNNTGHGTSKSTDKKDSARDEWNGVPTGFVSTPDTELVLHFNVRCKQTETLLSSPAILPFQGTVPPVAGDIRSCTNPLNTDWPKALTEAMHRETKNPSIGACPLLLPGELFDEAGYLVAHRVISAVAEVCATREIDQSKFTLKDKLATLQYKPQSKTKPARVYLVVARARFDDVQILTGGMIQATKLAEKVNLFWRMRELSVAAKSAEVTEQTEAAELAKEIDELTEETAKFPRGTMPDRLTCNDAIVNRLNGWVYNPTEIASNVCNGFDRLEHSAKRARTQ